MSRFLETIRIDKGNIPLLQYHNQRLNKTLKQFYPNANPIDLSTVFQVPSELEGSYVKCRVVYEDKIINVEYHEYQKKEVSQMKLVEANLKYDFKFEDRAELDKLYSQKGDYDDIIIVRDGWITDSYYGNVAFLKYGLWFTPKYPLLEGTMRQKLLDEGILTEADLPANSIAYYEKVRLFNSMIDFGEIELPIEKVFQLDGTSCKIP